MLHLVKIFLLFGSFFVYTYLFIIILFSDLNRKRTKITLSLFMLFASIFFALSVIKYLNYYQLFKYLNNFFWSILLFTFPLLYLYASSLFNRKWLRPICLVHFGPVIIAFVIGYFIHSSYTPDQIADYLQMKFKPEQNISEEYYYLELFAKSVSIIYLLQGILYFVLNIRMLHIHKKRFNDLFSNVLNKDLVRLRIIIYIIFAITIIYNFNVNVIGLDNIWSNDLTTIIVLVLIISLSVSLGILGTKQNSIYDLDLTILSNGNKNEINVPKLKSVILELFEDNRIYLNKDLTIWDICRLANSNRTYVSNLINQEFNMNFNSFVNKYRVEKAKVLLKEESLDGEGLEVIADKSGFNSLASFNRAFRRFENRSPGSFRNN